MRIVSWNCNGAFRRKFHLLDCFDADVLIIQECEEPDPALEHYLAWAGNYLWAKAGGRKGIGIFVKGTHELVRLDWQDENASLFLPVQIDGALQIVGVWTQAVRRASASYVGQLWQFLQLNQARLIVPTIVCGDFNSNTRWDKPRGVWDHSKCVKKLGDFGMRSLYHEFRGECQGEETSPTFFLQRNEMKPYHIDYAFVHETLSANAEPNFAVGDPATWLQHSDHMPLVFDI